MSSRAVGAGEPGVVGRQMDTTTCSTHGIQPSTFVCNHIVLGLASGYAVGFWWSREDPSERPDVWCTECEERLRLTNGEWTDTNVAAAYVRLLCGACYDAAKRLWEEAVAAGTLRTLPPN